MTLQAGPPPAMSVSQINTELGLAATTSHNLGAADMRTLAGLASGGVNMASFYGKTRRVVINYTLASNSADGNMRTAAIAAGWNTVTPIDLTVTINGGVYCYASSTGVYALLSGTFVALSIVKLVNWGGILGCGGAGGDGGIGLWLNDQVGAPGAAGGPGFGAQQAVTVTNNAWIAAGGGGGGGGGSGLQLYDPWWGSPAGGGGGGGRGNGAGGAGQQGVYGTSYPIAFGNPSAPGGTGSLYDPGAGGLGIKAAAWGTGGDGGAGGGAGGAGGTGVTSQCNWANAAGGAGGASNNAIVNNGYISWVTVGTIWGGIV